MRAHLHDQRAVDSLACVIRLLYPLDQVVHDVPHDTVPGIAWMELDHVRMITFDGLGVIRSDFPCSRAQRGRSRSYQEGWFAVHFPAIGSLRETNCDC
jgi:hypothetical protein